MTYPKPLTREQIITLSCVTFVGFCGLLGIDIHIASLPYIMRAMHTDAAHMQQSVSIFLLGLGLSLLIYGSLSDKYGRRPVVIFGLLLASLASYMSVLTHTITPFLITRFFQGVGSGVCMGLGRTMLADILQGERLATVGSYFALALSVSPLLAPPLGGYIQSWFSWQANFFVLGSLLLFTTVLFTVLCSETNKHKNPDALRFRFIVSIYWGLFRDRLFMLVTVLAGVALSINMVYATVSSIIFQNHFQLTVIEYGWVSMVAGLSSIVGRFISPWLLKKVGSITTLRVALWLFLIAGLWIIVCQALHVINVTLTMIGVVIAILGIAFVMPISMSYALSPYHERRGAAGAIYGSMQILFAFGFTSIISFYSKYGVIVMGLSYAVLGVFSLGVFHFGVKGAINGSNKE